MLRLGTNEDFDAIYEIYMHPTVNPYMGFEIMSKEEFRSLFHELATAGTAYVYENSDGQIVAACIVTRQQRRLSHVMTLSVFAVHPSYQGQGFGKRFLREIIAEIRKDETIKRIDLFAEVDNHKALNLYAKLGFENEGCLKGSFKRADEDHPIDEYSLAMTFD